MNEKDPAAQAIARALALPCWEAPGAAELLGGGITNFNVLIEDGGRRYVVRIGEDIPHHGVMRFNELAISRAAHAAGLAPAVIHAEPGAMVLEFVEAAPLSESDLQERRTREQVIEMIARCHRDVARHLRGPVLAFWVFHVIRDYAARLAEMGSPHAPLLAGMMAEAAAMEAAVGPVRLVLGHNDLLPANILRGEGRLWLIDWEYGGFNTPLFDLAGLASNAGLGPGAEGEMLRQYFGRAPDGGLMRRYRAMKCASLLRETLWSMVSEMTSGIDFDYAAYTAENLARYRGALGEFRAEGGAR